MPITELIPGFFAQKQGMREKLEALSEEIIAGQGRDA